MKPRLEALPFTDEDAAISVYLCLRNPGVMGRLVAGLFRFYQAADRRDARIMYLCGRALGNCRPPQVEWLILCCAAYWDETPWWDHASTKDAETVGILAT
jgi:hypothetical protein